MKQDFAKVVCIVDKSGSMNSLRSDTIGGFNSFIAVQRQRPGDATVTLVLFDHEYEVPFENVALPEFPELTEELYVPEGNTALLDAVGRTIVAVGAELAAMPEEERPAHVVFAIFTDGYENSSREYDNNTVAAMIKHQQDVYKWQFIFLGANIDAKAVASNLNIPRANAVSNEASAIGTQTAYAMASNSVAMARSGASAAIEPVTEEEVGEFANAANSGLQADPDKEFQKWAKKHP